MPGTSSNLATCVLCVSDAQVCVMCVFFVNKIKNKLRHLKHIIDAYERAIKDKHYYFYTNVSK